MDMDLDKYEPIFTIGTVAKRLGIAVQTVRMYEQEGLLLPHKTQTGRRMYSLHDFQRLLCIRKMITEHGINLNGIKKLFALIPCWDYRGGLDEDCKNCPVYYDAIGPCWSVREVGQKCRRQDCRECEVYRLPISCEKIKSIIYGESHRRKESTLKPVSE